MPKHGNTHTHTHANAQTHTHSLMRICHRKSGSWCVYDKTEIMCV